MIRFSNNKPVTSVGSPRDKKKRKGKEVVARAKNREKYGCRAAEEVGHLYLRVGDWLYVPPSRWRRPREGRAVASSPLLHIAGARQSGHQVSIAPEVLIEEGFEGVLGTRFVRV